MKAKDFQVEQIELCRNCQGQGMIPIAEGGAQLLAMCPVCQGSGRVRVIRKGVVTVEPYRGQI
jgi:DnaJ-class molecular chaperone